MFDPCLVLRFGGGSRGRGSFGSLGATVPWNDSPRARGGPWAPPPRLDVSIHCSSLSPCECFVGDVLCLVEWPFKFCPLYGFSVISPFFFCQLHCFCNVAVLLFSSCLSFSQALGKPKPPLGFGVPLVLLPATAINRTYTTFIFTHQACLGFVVVVDRAPFFSLSLSLSLFFLERQRPGRARSHPQLYVLDVVVAVFCTPCRSRSLFLFISPRFAGPPFLFGVFRGAASDPCFSFSLDSSEAVFGTTAS